jgi:hypothetical protein
VVSGGYSKGSPTTGGDLSRVGVHSGDRAAYMARAVQRGDIGRGRCGLAGVADLGGVGHTRLAGAGSEARGTHSDTHAH